MTLKTIQLEDCTVQIKINGIEIFALVGDYLETHFYIDYDLDEAVEHFRHLYLQNN